MKAIAFRLKQDQLLKEEIEKIVHAHKVKAGVLLSIVGGLENAYLRMPVTADNHEIKELNGPFEIVSGTGTLSSDGCHIHVSISDREGNVVGGHLKAGCRVRLTAEIVLGTFDNVSFARKMDTETGWKELEITEQ